MKQVSIIVIKLVTGGKRIRCIFIAANHSLQYDQVLKEQYPKPIKKCMELNFLYICDKKYDF